jgi:mannose-1-phosphate guanylyltransferase
VPKVAKNKSDYCAVDHFVEKPDKKTASRLIKKNALWNCGVFAFSIGFMLSRLRIRGLPVVYEELLAQYEHLPELSFDHEVVEKTRDVIVIPYDGAWKDLGSWTVLTDHLGTKIIGPGAVSDDSVNTHLINDLPYPVYVIDVPNIIVAASPDGILVASKTNSNRIKQMIAKDCQKPMYEERRWGTYQVLDHTQQEECIETLTKKIMLYPGKYISYQLHHKRKEIWTVLSGSGELMLDGTLSSVQAGDVVQIPPGTKHAVRALTPMEMIEVQFGSELVEDDIARLALTWEEAVRLGESKQG